METISQAKPWDAAVLPSAEAWLALLNVIGVTLAVVWAASALDCKVHTGDFNNDFSTALDISSLDCRLSENWTIHFWGVPPYVGL